MALRLPTSANYRAFLSEPVKLRFFFHSRNRSRSEGACDRRISSKTAENREGNPCSPGPFPLYSERFTPRALGHFVSNASTPLRSAQSDQYSLGASPVSSELLFKTVRSLAASVHFRADTMKSKWHQTMDGSSAERRRGRDSNPRYRGNGTLAFQASTFDHSVTPPMRFWSWDCGVGIGDRL